MSSKMQCCKSTEKVVRNQGGEQHLAPGPSLEPWVRLGWLVSTQDFIMGLCLKRELWFLALPLVAPGQWAHLSIFLSLSVPIEKWGWYDTCLQGCEEPYSIQHASRVQNVLTPSTNETFCYGFIKEETGDQRQETVPRGAKLTSSKVNLFFFSFLFYWQPWGLNSGPHTC
jgi:hypothetical protein